MPQYSYRCPNGHEFDELVKNFQAGERQVCPTCGKVAERVMASFGRYRIKGDNSASTVPKSMKHHGNESK